MRATFKLNEQLYTVNLHAPLDISIPLRASSDNVRAWYLDSPKIAPVILDNWVGRVSEGASVNFNTITFNPHAHGTHTECVGHISENEYSVNGQLSHYFYTAQVISVTPESVGDDFVISAIEIKSLLRGDLPEALVIRTLPNSPEKKSKHWSHTNWPYLEEEAARYLRVSGVKHLLVDLPSVDKEKDEGALLAHKAFWNYPDAPRMDATITEFVFVPNSIADGTYLLNLQLAAFENDAAPSRPVLYALE